MDFSKKGYGITFVDLDETLFKTFAKIHVVKNKEIIKKLSNKGFNTYVLGEGESFDFSEFRDSKLFKETSVSIPRTLEMIKEMMQKIKENKSLSRIIILTARADFNDKEVFLQTFIDEGIDVSNKELFYIERVGNHKENQKENGTKNISIAELKRNTILKYLQKGIYRRCRMIDDDLVNLDAFLNIEKELPEEITEKVRKTYSVPKKEKPIAFFALLMQDEGELKQLN